jgi:protocatechuate 3,4-dioxygenase beta subunit
MACICAILSVVLSAHAQTTTVKEPGATITGTVTIKGKGAPGVIVALRPNDRRYSGREYSGPRGVTDDEGKYRIVNVPAGNYRILPVANAYVPVEEGERERSLVVGKGETLEHIDFSLVPGGVITGKVVDAEGNPVVEEPVSVFALPDNRNVYVPRYFATDDRGVYRIFGLRAGSYRVAAGAGDDSFQRGLRPYKQTYHPSVNDPSQAAVVEVIEGGETKDIDITFTRTVPTYTVRGRIIDEETGQPIANVDYGITRHETRGSSSRSGGFNTNPRGEFKITGLTTGKYSITVSGVQNTDLRFEELPFEILDQDVTGLVIKGTRGGSISGVLVFEGLDDKTREQLGRAFLSVTIEDSPRQSRGGSVQVAADGTFQIRGLAAGTARFYLYGNGPIRVERVERDGAVQPGGLIIREREHIKGVRVIAQFGNASIRGQINVENGTLPPDARFHVWARLVDPDSRMFSSGSNVMPQVDSRGQFVMEGLTSGTYEIHAGVFLTSAKVGYAATKQVVVTAGSSVNVNITVDLTSTPIRP